MATTTPNFGWPVPTSTDLVKDGATAIEALGDSIDASLLDLKGGTTGQVLSKTSNTDMDFTWVTSDDANAIQNTIVDAKGDLITATAADTPARLGVGTNGQILTADSAESTGLKWATPASVTSGLTLVKTQTIGTGVSSVNVTSAFNSTYANYLITVADGTGSGNTTLNLKLGSTATGYYMHEVYGSYTSATVGGYASANGVHFYDAGSVSANNVVSLVNLYSPQLAKRTVINCFNSQTQTSGSFAMVNGYLDNATQYTDFTLTCQGAQTMTGGVIRVYGYQNS